MTTIQSIESLFSNVRRFTWRFIDNQNPSRISCIAFSVEDARERLLQYLQQIESLREEKQCVEEQIDILYKTNSYTAVRSEVTQLRNQVEQKLPLIENNIGCFCTPLFDYSHHMEVNYVNGGIWQEMTLQELILTTEPEVVEIGLVQFTSCLDG
jgi:uncharacterized protein (UPF0335 family)